MIVRAMLSACGAIFVFASLCSSAFGQVVPGTGTLVLNDDFEDGTWNYEPQEPKASSEQDKQDRKPGGYSANGVWSESALRGQPDIVKRVKTPDGGLEGSTASLMIRTLNAGVPGHRSYEQQQDDLLMNVTSQVGGYIPVSWTPSIVTRVYLPPWEYWENRSGAQFGFRGDLIGSKYEPPPAGMMFRKKQPPMGGFKRENYWPGMFICYQRKEESQTGKPYAYILVRSGDKGQDLSGPRIDYPGWWTLGMSFTADGRVHYYASPGVDNLTAADHITSQMPYGYRGESLYTMFYNVVNKDDGRSWSTPWVVDDPQVFWNKSGAPAAAAPRAAIGNRSSRQ